MRGGGGGTACTDGYKNLKICVINYYRYPAQTKHLFASNSHDSGMHRGRERERNVLCNDAFNTFYL